MQLLSWDARGEPGGILDTIALLDKYSQRTHHTRYGTFSSNRPGNGTWVDHLQYLYENIYIIHKYIHFSINLPLLKTIGLVVWCQRECVCEHQA